MKLGHTSQAKLRYDDNLTAKQDNLLLMSACIDESVYLLLLGWTIVNVKRYLIDQRRFKTFSILIFYILAVATEVSRLIMYFN